MRFERTPRVDRNLSAADRRFRLRKFLERLPNAQERLHVDRLAPKTRSAAVASTKNAFGDRHGIGDRARVVFPQESHDVPKITAFSHRCDRVRPRGEIAHSFSFEKSVTLFEQQ